MAHCKINSILAGREVDFPLIQVKLKNTATGNNFGVGYGNAGNTYNTAPIQQLINTPFTGGQSAHYRWLSVVSNINVSADATEVSAEYESFSERERPLVSNVIIKASECNSGATYRTLYETENVIVKLFVYKAVPASGHPRYNFTFTELDGSTSQNVETLVETGIAIYDKTTGDEIGYYPLNVKSQLAMFPNEFSFTTELYDLVDFDNKYLISGGTQYTSGSGWYFKDSGGRSDVKIKNNGQVVNGPTNHFVVPVISMTAYDYYLEYQPDTWLLYRHKTVNSDDTELSDNKKLDLSYDVALNFLVYQYNTNPNYCPNFLKIIPNWGFENDIVISDYANNVYSGASTIKSLSPNSSVVGFGPEAVRMSPILIPIVNTVNDEGYTTEPVTNGSPAYVPLTTVVYDDEPGPDPGPDPLPDWSEFEDIDIDDLADWDPFPNQGPETVTDSVDANTQWTPGTPEGYETYNYHVNENIGGMPGAINAYRPSYSNFIFRRVRSTNTTWNQDIMMFMFGECVNAGGCKLATNLYKIATGKPNISEIINRMYMLPFEYNEIMDTGLTGIDICAPVYGPLGVVTATYVQPAPNDDYEKGVEHYYKRLINKFKQFDFGTVTISRVFNNYLDYHTDYKLTLPYMAGTVDIDPNFLFRDKADSGTIHLVGWLDFDTAILVMKVIVNNNLYYETSCNVGVDMCMAAFNTAGVTASIAKTMIGAAVAAGTGSLIKGFKAADQSEEDSRRNAINAIANNHKRIEQDHERDQQQRAREAREAQIKADRQARKEADNKEWRARVDYKHERDMELMNAWNKGRMDFRTHMSDLKNKKKE